ncbi:MAG TPA: AI-2E family transporter [Patescibacteria group bacterium]|jgi:predicted PurR-regulated permease PerM|nr:AI-2E family transporter [Patescibacteria group bacterium]
MTLRLRSVFLIVVGLLLLWFLYLERAVLTPFVLAAIFAYIFNPVVNFFSHHLRLPRALSALIIYLAIVIIVAMAGMAFSSRIIEESLELKQEAITITKTAQSQINSLPGWLKPAVNETLVSFEKGTFISFPSVVSFVPKAFSRILSFIVFLFAAFYFLKEGRRMFDKMLNFVPNDYKIEADILIRKINSVLGGYLRGQIFLVFFVALALFISLTILGVKFALILAVFSGFAEIVPIIGPIVAASVAALAAFIGGGSNFGLAPLQMALAVVVIYAVVRQIQDYLINPYVMGKITKLHPLIILFAVIAGEHIAGIVGLILAVPIAGVIKIIFEYSLDKINSEKSH